MKIRTILLASLLACQSSYSASVFISEFHYDNDGGDVGEFVEIYLDSTLNISAVDLSFYNGSNGTTYDSVAEADWEEGASVVLGGESFTIFSALNPGIQNGGPDGLAVGIDGTLVEFLSYEGTFTATDGFANGATSTDVVASEGGGTPEGSSIQRTDAGFILTSGTNTRGAANPGLTVNPIPEPSSALLGGLGLLALFRRRR